MELKDLKVAEAVKLFKQKKLSPVEYTKSIIDEVRQHWDLNTVVNLNEEIAVRNAEESEKRYANGSELSKIDGIPIGIKDIIDTKDIITTYGCKGYREHYPKEDAFVIRKLKEAGANIFMKCNTSQFALGPTGEVSYDGPVKNARNPEYTTGGSSSGSASAVAGHLMPAALGSDSGGSIRVPSSICGTVGIKPTFSLVSNQGVMPVSETVDCVGPITRSVEDGAMILQTIAAYDINEWRSSPAPKVDYCERLNEGVKGTKVVVLSNLFEGCIMPEVVKGCKDAIDALKDAGAEIIEKNSPDVQDLRRAHQLNMLAMAHCYHLDDVKNCKEYIYDEVLARLESGSISSDECLSYEMQKNKMRKIIFDLMGDAECILYPTTPLTACKIGESRKMVSYNGKETCSFMANGSLTWASSFACTPCISVPAGFTEEKLAVGVSFMGRPFDDQNLIRIANGLQRSMGLEL
ncbi:MAG: amidase [Lachnospiraceae bacterium]|nr:amidase [Lachnospiraceae bacterium]